MKQELKNSLGRTFITTEYDVVNKWVYNNWLGYQTFDSIVLGANTCLEVIKKHHCSCLLNDNRQVIGPWNHAVEWIATDWVPRAVAAGLQFFAHVVDGDSLARASSEEMHQKVKGFEMQMFSDVEKARRWLNEKKMVKA